MSDSIPNYKDDKEAFYSYMFESGRTPEEIRQIYDEWAKEYEKSMEVERYDGPASFAEEFDKLGLEKDSKILDMCCGTGLFGKLLKSKGYSNIHGLDGSPGMLSVAKSENVYQSYEECLLTEGTRTSYPDGHFDAIVVCGGFGPGHLRAEEAFPELIRITRPGGIIAWLGSDPNRYLERTGSCEEHLKNLSKKIAKLVDEKKWKEYKEPVRIGNFIEGRPGYVHFMQVV